MGVSYEILRRLSPFSRRYRSILVDALQRTEHLISREQDILGLLDRVQRDPTEFFVTLRITGSEIVRVQDLGEFSLTVEWDYQFEQVQMTTEWEPVVNGHTHANMLAPLKNLAETAIGHEVHGSGIVYAHIPLGFEIQPLPDGRIVYAFARLVTLDGIPRSQFWCDIPNAVSGTCVGQPLSEPFKREVFA